MKGETKSRLDAALKKYDERMEQAQSRAAERKAQEQTFEAQFERTAREVIRPVMEELGAAIKQKGHDFEIASSARGIELKVFPRGIARHDFSESSTPHVAFIANTSQTNVVAHRSTMLPRSGGSSGSTGEYPVDRITADVVEREILDLLEMVLGGKF